MKFLVFNMILELLIMSVRCLFRVSILMFYKSLTSTVVTFILYFMNMIRYDNVTLIPLVLQLGAKAD